jgi:hypothetical protein
MGWTCSMHRLSDKYVRNFSWKLEVRDYLGDLDLDEDNIEMDI